MRSHLHRPGNQAIIGQSKILNIVPVDIVSRIEPQVRLKQPAQRQINGSCKQDIYHTDFKTPWWSLFLKPVRGNPYPQFQMLKLKWGIVASSPLRQDPSWVFFHMHLRSERVLVSPTRRWSGKFDLIMAIGLWAPMPSTSPGQPSLNFFMWVIKRFNYLCNALSF